eukprot:639153-Hanusia_phi.AAC.2
MVYQFDGGSLGSLPRRKSCRYQKFNGSVQEELKPGFCEALSSEQGRRPSVPQCRAGACTRGAIAKAIRRLTPVSSLEGRL